MGKPVPINNHMYTLSTEDLIHWRGRHGPSWRCILARELAASSRPPRVADQLIIDVSRFLRLRGRGSDSAAVAGRAFPKITQAFACNKTSV